MIEFWIYFENGLRHILNLLSCKHILFLVVLTVPYESKDWKKIVLLVSFFTIGNMLALMLSFFGVIVIKLKLIGFLTPIIILLVALYAIFTAGKSSKQVVINWISFITLFIGILHGLGFANYFNSTASESHQSTLLSILEFSLGIQLGQIMIVMIVLLFSYIFQTVFRFSKRDWILVMSSLVIGVVLPMIIRNEIWKSLN